MTLTKAPILLAALFAMYATHAHAARVDSVEIFSAAMRKNIKCLVVTPQDYRFTGEPYPVLYLLHGWSGNYAGWLGDAPQLLRHADAYQMLIVCPDGGYDSWYLDSPVDSTVRYDTHIAREVVAYVDYYYHTRREPGGRAIAGLSMGGHGAISLALKHPDVFGAAGSMAGGLDLRPWKKNGWDLQGVLGNPLTHWQNWEENTVVGMLHRLKGRTLPLMIDCGVDDFFIEGNRLAHQLLLDMGHPHEYTERPGAHDGDYWGSAVDFQIVFFHKFFGKNKGKP
jgi:S-formylglutathione hydrolase FrmB